MPVQINVGKVKAAIIIRIAATVNNTVYFILIALVVKNFSGGNKGFNILFACCGNYFSSFVSK